jgi:hypothetical protein
MKRLSSKVSVRLGHHVERKKVEVEKKEKLNTKQIEIQNNLKIA